MQSQDKTRLTWTRIDDTHKKWRGLRAFFKCQTKDKKTQQKTTQGKTTHNKSIIDR